MPTTPPRDVDTIDRAIAAVSARQRTKIAARDRRDNDMLRALADVEQYEAEIRADKACIDDLFDERERATHARIGRDT